MTKLSAKVSASDFYSATTQSMLKKVERTVESFERVLDGERVVMKARHVDELPAIAASKDDIVRELMRYEVFMGELFTQFADKPAVIALKKQLQVCRNLNRANQSVVSVELQTANKSLEFLRSLQQLDDLPLYSAAGQINILREKRNLGEA